MGRIMGHSSALFGSALACAVAMAVPVAAQTYVETPALMKAVAAGTMPSVDTRLPETPLVTRLIGKKSAGRHGGELHMLIGRATDLRLLVVYGYARLVGYDENYDIFPDILESVDVIDDRVFTFRLRKGHKWSDGHPFTSEDFRYYWQDMANQ
ncbi:MAG: ABC transporter substrate-binding protein, partial [Proteobacteria bacterium]|nr:ABC transporter substrate-binding protein [Pseudomonadota bacterium]